MEDNPCLAVFRCVFLCRMLLLHWQWDHCYVEKLSRCYSDIFGVTLHGGPKSDGTFLHSSFLKRSPGPLVESPVAACFIALHHHCAW